MQLADAKKKVDEDQQEIEELQGAKRKVDKEIESLHERIEELTAENQKTARSKKKIQGEVGTCTYIPCKLANLHYFCWAWAVLGLWNIARYIYLLDCMYMYMF